MSPAPFALLLYAALVLFSVHDLVAEWGHYVGQDTLVAWGLLGSRIVLCVLALRAGATLWRGRSTLSIDGVSLRLLVYTPAAGLLAATLVHPLLAPGQAAWLLRSLFFCALLAGLWAWPIWLERRPPILPAWLRGLDVVAMNALIALIALEALLASWARVAPSPLFASRSSKEWLESRRWPAGREYFGVPTNRGGYYDDEFFVADGDDVVVAVIGDSFVRGVVPLAYNFVGLAEAALQDRLANDARRVAVHNFGVDGVGVVEYGLILEQDVLATNPGIVVVVVYVGNDIHWGHYFGEDEVQRHALQRWQLWTFGSRVITLLSEPAESLDRVADIGTLERGNAQIPDWVEDSSLEEPTFTEERYLFIVENHLTVADPDAPEMSWRWPAFREALAYLRERLGERFVLVIAPDEFQVNDSLWRQSTERVEDPSRLDRDLPQARILDYCRELDIACLDLLPSLRAAEGAGHTYHLRNTHWNARGNAVAGEALARFLELQLAESADSPRN